MKNLLWLDDLRNPFLDLENKVPGGNHKWNINWVRDHFEFTAWIRLYGLPDAMSFDHDLAPDHYTPAYFWGNYDESEKYQKWASKDYAEPTGEDCAKWFVSHLDAFAGELPEIFIHSANPVGVDRIKEVFRIAKLKINKL